MISVELVLDAATEATVREEWRRLIEAGLPSAGRHSGESNRPHLTLAARDELGDARLHDLAEMLPMPLDLDGIVLFGSGARFVLARHVVLNAALAAFHGRIAERLEPAAERFTNTLPDSWTPHVTLARRLNADQVASALGAARVVTLRAAAVGLRVWDADAREVITIR